MPVTLDELDGLNRANDFDIFSAAERAQGEEPWAEYFDTEQSLDILIQRVIEQNK